MEVITVCMKIYSAWGGIKKLRAFVMNDLAGMLEAFGDVEYKAAIRALHDARKSKEPKSHITNAVGCLRTAYYSFNTAVEKMSFYRQIYGHRKQYELHEKAFVTVLAMAAIFKASGDRTLELDYMENARTSIGSCGYHYSEILASWRGSFEETFERESRKKYFDELEIFEKLYKLSTGRVLDFEDGTAAKEQLKELYSRRQLEKVFDSHIKKG